MRILALDIGEKRIGIAISDPTSLFASPRSVIIHRSITADVEEISELIHENEIKTVVIGIATDFEGGETLSSRRSRKYGRLLENLTHVGVCYVDESFSTLEAKEIAINTGKKKKDRKGHQDPVAAAIILQRYLDSVIRYDKSE